jgi:AraC family transcriptional regulator
MGAAHPGRVRITDFAETRVAVFEHRGDPKTIDDSIRRFIEWRKQNHVPPRVSATFNILYGDPATTRPEDFRLDLSASIDGPVAANDLGIVEKIIPGGRCAVLRYVGSDDALGAALEYLRGEWLAQSGERLRDFPQYLQRVRFFPEVPPHEAIVDVFLPLV